MSTSNQIPEHGLSFSALSSSTIQFNDKQHKQSEQLLSLLRLLLFSPKRLKLGSREVKKLGKTESSAPKASTLSPSSPLTPSRRRFHCIPFNPFKKPPPPKLCNSRVKKTQPHNLPPPHVFVCSPLLLHHRRFRCSISRGGG